MSDARTGEWNGRQVVDTTGAKIGSVSDVYFDDSMDRPEWLVVKTGLFGSKRVYVPARDVRTDGDRLMVPYTEDRVKDAPQVGKSDSLSHDEEQELYLYYGLEYPEPAMTAPSGTTGTTAGGPGVAPRERETVGTGSRER